MIHLEFSLSRTLFKQNWKLRERFFLNCEVLKALIIEAYLSKIVLPKNSEMAYNSRQSLVARFAALFYLFSIMLEGGIYGAIQ
jgi:hypothetical protein